MRINNTETFILKSKQIHSGIYHYGFCIYSDSKSKLPLTCNKHGCSKCSTSKGESKIIKYLKKNNIKYDYQHRYNGCKNIYILPFDFYIPKYNLMIEFNGIQHYKEVDIFGGKSYLESVIINDNIKKEYCKNKHIKLLTIPYYFYNNIEDYLNYLLF